MRELDGITFEEHIQFYKTASAQVSEEHPMFCVCGRLCTGLHEMRCGRFLRAVESRTKKLERQYLKNKKKEVSEVQK